VYLWWGKSTKNPWQSQEWEKLRLSGKKGGGETAWGGSGTPYPKTNGKIPAKIGGKLGLEGENPRKKGNGRATN